MLLLLLEGCFVCFLHPGVLDPNLALFTSTTVLLEKLVLEGGGGKSFSLAMVGQIDEPNFSVAS